jgi:hypothetical protein
VRSIPLGLAASNRNGASSPWDGQGISHPPGEAGLDENPSEGFTSANVPCVARACSSVETGLVGGTGLEQTSIAFRKQRFERRGTRNWT